MSGPTDGATKSTAMAMDFHTFQSRSSGGRGTRKNKVPNCRGGEGGEGRRECTIGESGVASEVIWCGLNDIVGSRGAAIPYNAIPQKQGL